MHNGFFLAPCCDICSSSLGKIHKFLVMFWNKFLFCPLPKAPLFIATQLEPKSIYTRIHTVVTSINCQGTFSECFWLSMNKNIKFPLVCAQQKSIKESLLLRPKLMYNHGPRGRNIKYCWWNRIPVWINWTTLWSHVCLSWHTHTQHNILKNKEAKSTEKK